MQHPTSSHTQGWPVASPTPQPARRHGSPRDPARRAGRRVGGTEREVRS
jgi:hypothetical protein